MFRQTLFALILVGAVAFLVGCDTLQASPTTAPNIANPASVYCEQNGGKLELTQDATGGAIGVCKFPDKTECEEWAFFRGQCKKGDKPSAPAGSPAPSRVPAATPVSSASGG